MIVSTGKTSPPPGLVHIRLTIGSSILFQSMSASENPQNVHRMPVRLRSWRHCRAMSCLRTLSQLICREEHAAQPHTCPTCKSPIGARRKSYLAVATTGTSKNKAHSCSFFHPKRYPKILSLSHLYDLTRLGGSQGLWNNATR